MRDTRETLEQALRAVDASLSVLVVTRDQIINALDAFDKPPQVPDDPGAVPAGCAHPLSECVDVGVASGVMVCGVCGEEVLPDGVDSV